MMKWSRQRQVVDSLVAKLANGARFEAGGFYMGCTSDPRPDPFWYEYKGGRTYKELPEEVVLAVLRHVGAEALERAKELPP